MTGELLWLSTRARPDLSHTVHVMSSNILRCPQWVAQVGKGALRYLKGSVAYGLCYSNFVKVAGDEVSDYDELRKKVRRPTWAEAWSGKGALLLEGYGDASFAPWAGVQDVASLEVTARSITGVAVYLGENLIAWRSQTQSTVSSSSAEAELNALLACCHLSLAVSSLFTAAGTVTATRLHCDNTATLAMVSTGTALKTRHLSIRAGVIRCLMISSTVDLTFVGTQLQRADTFTKALGRTLFEHSRSSHLGLSVPAAHQTRPELAHWARMAFAKMATNEQKRKTTVTAHAVDVVQEMVAKAALNVLTQGLSSTFDQWLVAREGVSHPVQVPEQVCPAPDREVVHPWACFLAGTAVGALALKTKEWLEKRVCPRRLRSLRSVGVQAPTTYVKEPGSYATGRFQTLSVGQQKTSIEVGQPFAQG
jgi:hypothetical protein